ncbi:unnamed protein product [Mytilus coruscus]|uniref:C1q domain-containing protein n=1 Tax=Mytilus coruscus TaxID=42192 RepID=A0A6J8A0Q3_MYTCO|nr:unnamed protein product [Mytilus coruscus]
MLYILALVRIVEEETEVKTLKERLDNLTETVEKGRKHGIPTVMFFVRLSSATTLNKNSIVKFDHVITDTGNNFNPGDGIFVAPVSGIYLFSWTTLAYTSKYVDTELRVDNVIVASSYGYIGTSSNIPVTKVILCQVKKGDHVWIQTSRHITENYFNNPYDSRKYDNISLYIKNQNTIRQIDTKKKSKTLKERLDNLTETVEKGRTHGNPTVMFFVRLTAATTPNKNSIVKFDQVITDTGNNFNPGDGIFVAPVSGIYLFSWTTLAHSSKYVDTELRVDNVIVASSYGYIGTASYIPVTKVVLCQVKKGDHVWIQTSRHTTENYFDNTADSRSSFTGMLVVKN